MSFYTVRIQRALGCTEREAALVEGYMRCEVSSLDHLDSRTFDGMAKAAWKEVETDPRAAEANARSFGLLR